MEALGTVLLLMLLIVVGLVETAVMSMGLRYFTGIPLWAAVTIVVMYRIIVGSIKNSIREA